MFVTQAPIGFTCYIVDYGACIPFAVAKKLMKVALFRIRDNFRHPVHVFTRFDLHQAASVLAGFFENGRSFS